MAVSAARNPASTAEEIGLGVIGAVAALTTVHAVGSVIRNQKAKKREPDLSRTREEPPQAPNLAATNEATEE